MFYIQKQTHYLLEDNTKLYIGDIIEITLKDTTRNRVELDKGNLCITGRIMAINEDTLTGNSYNIVLDKSEHFNARLKVFNTSYIQSIKKI